MSSRYKMPFILGMIPVVLFSVAFMVTPKAKPKAQPTYVDQVADSFTTRFPEDTSLVEKRVRTITISKPAPVDTGPLVIPPSEAVARTNAADVPDGPSVTRVRATRRGDTCSRHHMRKVWVSSKRWRCRR
jgi:hypothetical protein